MSMREAVQWKPEMMAMPLALAPATGLSREAVAARTGDPMIRPAQPDARHFQADSKVNPGLLADRTFVGPAGGRQSSARQTPADPNGPDMTNLDIERIRRPQPKGSGF